MSIKDRIKAVRKAQKATQSAFGELLGCGRDTIANYETGRVSPSDTFIQLLCAKFSINETWLRTGDGKMMAATEDTMFADFAARYHLSEEDKAAARYFLSLTSTERHLILNHVRRLADVLRSVDDADRHAVDDRADLHRQLDAELDAEEKAQSVSTRGSSGTADGNTEKRA